MSSDATPGVSDMDRTTTAEPLAALQNLRVRQTLKGCLQTLLGCDANEQFRLSALENPAVELFSANEDTDCLVRIFCQSNRPMTINLTQGGDKGPRMLQFERPFACPICCGKCCCLQEMHVHDAQRKNLGMVQEASCWWCVPRFNVVRPDGTREFTVKPPVCCGGLCMDCRCAGCMKCRVPGTTICTHSDAGVIKPGLINVLVLKLFNS